jgi:hypothetical protein
MNSPLNKMLADLVSWLNGATGIDGRPALNTLVRSITLDEAPQGLLPYVVIDVTAGDRNQETQSHGLANQTMWEHTVQINCDAANGPESREIAAAMESAMDRLPQFTGGNSTIFQAVKFQGEFAQVNQNTTEGINQDSENTYRHSISFTILYHQS